MPKDKVKKNRPGRTKEEKTSYIMSRIHGKDTAIEVLLRKALWHKGVRYRKNYRKLPGVPDIAITKYKIAIFCDGEFWHGKDFEKQKANMHTNRDYWVEKIERNMARDIKNGLALEELGWTVMRFWGKDIEKSLDTCVERVLAIIVYKRAGVLGYVEDEL